MLWVFLSISIYINRLKDGSFYFCVDPCLFVFTPVLNTFYEFNLAFDLAAFSIGRKIRFGVIRFGVGVDKTKCWTSWICFTFVTFIPWIYSFEVSWEVIFTEWTYFSFSRRSSADMSVLTLPRPLSMAEMDGHDFGQSLERVSQKS